MSSTTKTGDSAEGLFDEDWFENLAVIEIVTREKGFKEGYKAGELIAAGVGVSTASEVSPGPGYDFGCFHSLSRVYLEELKNKKDKAEGEKDDLLTSLTKEIAHKTEKYPEDVLQAQRDVDGIRFKIELHERQIPVFKLLRSDLDVDEGFREDASSQSGDELF